MHPMSPKAANSYLRLADAMISGPTLEIDQINSFWVRHCSRMLLQTPTNSHHIIIEWIIEASKIISGKGWIYSRWKNVMWVTLVAINIFFFFRQEIEFGPRKVLGSASASALLAACTRKMPLVEMVSDHQLKELMSCATCPALLFHSFTKSFHVYVSVSMDPFSDS